MITIDNCSAMNRGTFSVCPVCLKRIPAVRVPEADGVYLHKSCPEHGHFSTIIWRNYIDMEAWAGHEASILPGENDSCPSACGLCPEHKRDTCCTLLEITSRCNLRCPHCFAPAEKKDEPLEVICEKIHKLVKPGETYIQLSGGEPTMRSDLPQIIREAKAAGCSYVQLNTNGIRIAREPDYAAELARAGLSVVFLQFDSLRDEVYRTLRGESLVDSKLQTLRACADAGLGVTLVPMVVPGVNDLELGEILQFAVKNSPCVRGVHFQPVTYLGRAPHMPDSSARITLDELIYRIHSQSNGLVSIEDFRPSCCDHSLCGFHSDFIVEDGRLKRLSVDEDTSSCKCCCESQAKRNRDYIGMRWSGAAQSVTGEEGSMEHFLSLTKSRSFTITAMAFQDAGNLDLERLRKCSLHVYSDGKMIPFCSYYLTAWSNGSC